MPAPDDRQPDRAADHRITVRHIPTPAASSSSIARAPSPGLRFDGRARIGEDVRLEAEARSRRVPSP